jgi:type II secretory pathway pseudopilin PulG
VSTPRKERSYNLVGLVVLVTLLNIGVAAALPAWSHIVKHDKEEELIFRGLQYAEAIRVFQVRFGRAPTSLQELLKTKPRSVRQLWHNPMREDGRWGLIPVGQALGVPGVQQPGAPQSGQGQGDKGGESNGQNARPGQPPGVILSAPFDDKTFGTPAGSGVGFRGVFNPEGSEAIHSFLAKESTREWQFTVELISAIQAGTPDNPAFVRPFLAKDIGKPWPPGVTPPGNQPSSDPRPGGPAGHPTARNPDGTVPGHPTIRPPEPQQPQDQ